MSGARQRTLFWDTAPQLSSAISSRSGELKIRPSGRLYIKGQHLNIAEHGTDGGEFIAGYILGIKSDLEIRQHMPQRIKCFAKSCLSFYFMRVLACEAHDFHEQDESPAKR